MSVCLRRVLLASCLVPISLLAEDTRIESLQKSLGSVSRFRETAISPDGSRLLWVEGGRRGGSIFRADLAGKGPKRISAIQGDDGSIANEHSAAWSPDSSRIGFLSDAQASSEEHGQLQLFVASGNSVKRLTSWKGFLARPKWSPDGKQIAVLFTEDAPRVAGPTEAITPDSGVVEDKIFEQRLAIVDAETGKSRILTPADMYVYEFDWSPDGKRLVYTAAQGNGDNNWYIANLYTIDIAGGAQRLLLSPGMQVAVPRWSPDGKTVAFIGGLMSDEGINGGDIYFVPAEGGEPRDVTPGRKSSPAWLQWQPNGQLLFTEHIDGGSAIATLNPSTGVTETLWRGDEQIGSGGDALSVSVARDGRTTALIRSSFDKAPEVWTGVPGEWKAFTHRNESARREWGAARSIHWTSDGAQVQGWLLHPKEFDPTKKYPMIVMIHGGPSSAVTPSWIERLSPEAFTAFGYFVFLPNPRGSYGQGEAFTRGNIRDFGYGDLRDILAGVDAVLREAPVDPERLGVTGWSYGGYMTMWTVTQTQRFKAAVAGAGIANFQSYYGENAIDQWMLPFFGKSVYDDPEIYARSSPITFIKNVKTPTLVVVGERDGECPAPQSYEFWHALKTLGVPTQLVVYPGEGHGFHDPEHTADYVRRTLAWFDKYLDGLN